MSILTSTHCGILGYKLTDKIIQQNLGFNGDIFREFGNFFYGGYGSYISKIFIHKDYPNLIITKIKCFEDRYFYYISYIPLREVFCKVLLGDWKKFQQTHEYSHFKEVELKYVYCADRLIKEGYDVLNFIDEHKDFLIKSAISIYEAANFLIKNTNHYKGFKL